MPLYLYGGVLLYKNGALAASQSCCCDKCTSTTFTVAGASSSPTYSDLYINGPKLKSIVWSSSGCIEYRKATPTRPAGIHCAPTNLRLYIGSTVWNGTLASAKNSSGLVGGFFPDNPHTDNSGYYTVNVTICEYE